MRTVPSSSCAITGTRPRSSNFTCATKPSGSRGAAATFAIGLLRTDIDPPGAQERLRLVHGVLPVVEDRGRQGRVGDGEPLGEVLEGAHAARGDDRDGDRTANPLQELEVVPGLRPVAVHGGEEELARPPARDLP